MDISNGTCFVCKETGESFVYGSKYAKPLLYSADGITYYELVSNRFGGTASAHDVDFADPHHGITGSLSRDAGKLYWEEKEFNEADCPEKIHLVPLPPARKPVYLYKLRDGRFIFVSTDIYKGDSSFRLFIGDAQNMRRIPVQASERFYANGTTVIRTLEGTLFSPPRGTKYQRPNWKGEILRPLKPERYKITENEVEAVIRK